MIGRIFQNFLVKNGVQKYKMFNLFQNGYRECLYLRNLSTTKATNYPNKTHYEVLKLSRDCTGKDIRNAFLKLSKKYHPDRNTDKNSHTEYVKILEAYKVLSKPSSKHDYDLGLSSGYSGDSQNIRYADTRVWMDQQIWEHRDKNQDRYYESKPYYGIKGVRKVSNSLIVFLCITVAVFGVTLQIMAIRYSFTLRRDDLNRKSSELEELHAKIRSQALKNGDKKQLELLKARLGYQDD